MKETPQSILILRMHEQLDAIKQKLNGSQFVEIEITKSLYALADPECERDLRRHNWMANITRGGHIYAVADIEGHRVSMQRLVHVITTEEATLETTKHVSFANKCSLDCRSFNLRNRSNRTAAMRNRRKKRGASSKYKGVIKRATTTGGHVYGVSIGAGPEMVIYLGKYDDEVFAAEVYDAAASMLFEGASLANFPDQNPTAEALEAASLRIHRWHVKKKQSKDTQAR